MRRFGLLLIGLLAIANRVEAQRFVQVDGLPTTTASLTSTTCPGSGCTIPLEVSGNGSVGIQVTGTFTATLQFRSSVDRSDFTPPLNCTPPNSTTPVTSTTSTGAWTCDVAGLAQVRVQASAYTSGTAVVTIQASPAGTARGQAPAGSGGTASAFGAAFPANGTAIGFKDSSGTNMAAGNLDAGGRVIVNCGSGCSGASDTVGSTTALNALNVVASVALTAEGGAGVHIAAGTLAATVTPQISMDGGSTYIDTLFFNPSDQTTASSLVFTNPNVATERAILVAAGASHARVKVTAFTSGAADATVRATANGGGNYVTLSAGSTVRATNFPTTADTNNGATGASTLRFTLSNDSTGQVKATNFPATVDVNNGNVSANTPRVTLAADSTGQVKVTNLPTTADVNNGATGASTLRFTLSNDSTGQVKTTNWPTTVDVNNGAVSANTPRVTIANDSTGQIKATNFPTTVTLNAGAADASTLRAAADVTRWNGQAVASPDGNSYVINANAATATSGAAASACNILSAASTNSTNCKGSAGNFYGYEIFNTTTTVYYLRLYNASSAPTCSSATGFIRSIPIPPAAAAGQVGGAVSNQATPVNYSTGIGYCITAGSSSTDNTNAATGLFGEIRYK